LKVSLLTGGGDKPYALGLLNALISKGVTVDFIGNDEMSNADIVKAIGVNYLNLRGNQNPRARDLTKLVRVLRYYFRLLKYVTVSDSPIFHILWFNKFIFLDRTLLNAYYKLLGKKLVFTAHNVDEKERDGGNNFLNRLSLRILYSLVDHIFVHTKKMKSQLTHEFKVREDKVSVIPFGINNTIPTSNLTKAEARAKLNLGDYEKVLLCFGNIAPYKGLEYAIRAMDRLREKDDSYRLVIAGQIKGCQAYWEEVEGIVEKLHLSKYVMNKTEYIPDEEVEVFFKSSDVLLLPYKFIYQSGVLFLSYSFGLPVIATDVGSLREDIVEGSTGMICRAEDPDDLADKVRRYFDSDLYRNLDENMKHIISYGNEKHSWDEVGNTTYSVYGNLLAAK
jgi:glycosyltransferase involved in cell wall biosynthesis